MTLQDMYDSRVNRIPISRPYTKMAGILISAKEIDSLLKKLIPNKASGPDPLKPILLQTLHKELAPILQVIFVGPLTRPNNLAFGRKQMCPQYLKRVTRLIPQITASSPLHLS